MSMTELRSDWLIGYYALGRDKFSAKTISVNNLQWERVDFKVLNGRWRLWVMGSCLYVLEFRFIMDLAITYHTLLLLPLRYHIPSAPHCQ